MVYSQVAWLTLLGINKPQLTILTSEFNSLASPLSPLLPLLPLPFPPASSSRLSGSMKLAGPLLTVSRLVW